MVGLSLTPGVFTASGEYMIVDAEGVNWLHHPQVSLARNPYSQGSHLILPIEHRAQHLSGAQICLCKDLDGCSNNYWSWNEEDAFASLWSWCSVQHLLLSFPVVFLHQMFSSTLSHLFVSIKWDREQGWAPIAHGKMNLQTAETSTIAKSQEPCHPGRHPYLQLHTFLLSCTIFSKSQWVQPSP